LNFELQAYLQERKRLIDQSLDQYLPAEDRLPPKLSKAVRYSVLAGGKRIRPILLLAAYEVWKDDYLRALPFACALEMVHAYSLIHDDLPAMDDDDFRRGKPTSHKAFGEAMAILAGDALQAEAFGLMARAGRESFTPQQSLAAIRELADGAGLNGMAAGQAMDMETQGRQFGSEELEFIHSRKTGALIRAAVKVGAILAGADEKSLRTFSEFGGRVGLAFQVADDVLDAVGGEKSGKAGGSDARKKKATYVGLFGLKQSQDRAKTLVSESIELIKEYGTRAEPLRQIARFLAEREY